MDCRTAFQYCYNFCADHGIIPLYDRRLSTLVTSDERRWYLFEIRTNFKLNIRFHDHQYPLVVNMGSERFGIPFVKEGELESLMRRRLAEYRMLDRQIQWLARDALNYIEKVAAEPPYTAIPVIPVVVELDVWTVQLEGESIDEAVDRAVRPESLYHLRLCNVILRDSDQFRSDENVYLNEGKLRGLSCNVTRVLTDSDQSSSDHDSDADSDSESDSYSKFNLDAESDCQSNFDSESNSDSKFDLDDQSSSEHDSDADSDSESDSDSKFNLDADSNSQSNSDSESNSDSKFDLDYQSSSDHDSDADSDSESDSDSKFNLDAESDSQSSSDSESNSDSKFDLDAESDSRSSSDRSDHDSDDFGFSSYSQSDVSSFESDSDSEAQSTGGELERDSNSNYLISEYDWDSDYQILCDSDYECTQTLQVWI